MESGHDPVLTSSGVDDRVNQLITGTLLVHRRRPDRQKKVNKEAKCRLFDDIHVKGSHEVLIP